MIILELFSGTKSFSKVAEKLGHKTFTIDNQPKLKPDLCTDILNLDIKQIPKEFRKPHIIWASPPCTTFSVASICRYWKNGKPKNDKALLGISLVLKTISIIKELKPKYWFIENPRGMLRKQPFMVKLPKDNVSYCQYGFKYMKSTDIFNNCNLWIAKKACKPGANCHIAAPRGSQTGTQGIKGAKDRGMIPPNLCKEILESIEKPKIIQENLI